MTREEHASHFQRRPEHGPSDAAAVHLRPPSIACGGGTDRVRWRGSGPGERRRGWFAALRCPRVAQGYPTRRRVRRPHGVWRRVRRPGDRRAGRRQFGERCAVVPRASSPPPAAGALRI